MAPQEKKLAHSTDPIPEEKRARRIVRGHILFAFGLLLTLGLAWLLAKEILLIYVSALFAAVLMPVVNRIMKINLLGRQSVKTCRDLSARRRHGPRRRCLSDGRPSSGPSRPQPVLC